jgi:hypothetical protein
MKVDRLIKMCLNETYNTVCIGKNLSDAFPNKHSLKGDGLSALFFNFAPEYVIRRSKKLGRIGTERDLTAPGLC